MVNDMCAGSVPGRHVGVASTIIEIPIGISNTVEVTLASSIISTRTSINAILSTIKTQVEDLMSRTKKKRKIPKVDTEEKDNKKPTIRASFSDIIKGGNVESNQEDVSGTLVRELKGKNPQETVDENEIMHKKTLVSPPPSHVMLNAKHLEDDDVPKFENQ